MKGSHFMNLEKLKNPGGLRTFVITGGMMLLGSVLPFLLCFELAYGGVADDIRALRTDMEHMKKDLAEIKSLLQGAIKRPIPEKSTGTVSITGRPMLGKMDAPVTIVEFSDYQCPYCRRYSLTVFPVLKRDFIDTGKVRYVFRDFPLSSIHREAQKAHESAHCAGEHQKYWEMHDVLFQQQRDLMVTSLKKYGASLGIDSEVFAGCLDSGRYEADIQKDVGQGTAAGVRGTPSFFIGKSESGDSITGTMIRGAQPLAHFQQVINQMLEDHASNNVAEPTGSP